MCIDSALLYSIHAYMYISKTLLFILITIYTHVSFSAQPSKFHYVIGGQLHNEIQSAHILETSMSAKEVACGINVHVTILCRLDVPKTPSSSRKKITRTYFHIFRLLPLFLSLIPPPSSVLVVR